MRSDGADRSAPSTRSWSDRPIPLDRQTASPHQGLQWPQETHAAAGSRPSGVTSRFFDIFERREYTLSIMKRYLVVLLAAGAALVARPALAHHSFSATYLETQTQTIEGEIIQFVFRNPHSFVHVNVQEKDGSITVYNIEWGGTGQLNNSGVTRETLKAGDV